LSKLALGIIETVGLAAAIEAADTAVKSANVELIGYELSKGGGMITVKIQGNVGAVNAGISAAIISASKVNKVYGSIVIARPSDGLKILIDNNQTVGMKKLVKQESIEEVVEESVEETIEEAVEELVEETIEEAVEELVEETIEEAVEELVEETIEESVEESVEGPIERPFQENGRELIYETSQEFIQELTEEESIEKESIEEEVYDKSVEGITCNICRDPMCPRKKGDLRKMCIHYIDIKKKEVRINESSVRNG
jgi:microcompartment protein CcmL/EutN